MIAYAAFIFAAFTIVQLLDLSDQPSTGDLVRVGVLAALTAVFAVTSLYEEE